MPVLIHSSGWRTTVWPGPIEVRFLIDAGEVTVQNFSEVDLLASGIGPVAGRRGEPSGLLTVGTQKPDSRPRAGASSEFRPYLNRAVREVEFPHLDSTGRIAG